MEQSTSLSTPTQASPPRGDNWLRRLFAPDSMLVIVGERLLQGIPSVIGVITLGFILLNLAPGDPALYLIGENSDPQYLAEVRERLGLDAPLHVRYITYVTNVLQGNLGSSFYYTRPVTEIIWERTPATLLLFIVPFILSTVLGIGLGVFAAAKKGSVMDNGTVTLSVLWYTVPVFWSGQLLLLLFSLQLGWFPSFGMRSIGMSGKDPWTNAMDIAWHLVLPTIALTLYSIGLITRLTRSSIAESLREDYITTARAKGLSEGVVLRKHALRNALLPVITVLGLSLGRALAGAVLVETVFSWPGLGRLMFDSISRRDYPVVLGLFLIISIFIIAANLITDLVYAWTDPRVRHK